ncbi:MAG: C25 family cysteine peptidase [Planctomycetota bacterium]
MPRSINHWRKTRWFVLVAIVCTAVCSRSSMAQHDVHAVARPLERTLMIVHGSALSDAADAWAAYRLSTGWNVVVAAVPAIDDENARRHATQRMIRDTAQRHANELFAVLLLGSTSENGIPTFMHDIRDVTLREHRVRTFASDENYQYINDRDTRPDFPLGRIPARTFDEAMIVLEKTRRYEQQQNFGTWRRRVTFVAGEGHFGPADALLEHLFRQLVAWYVPETFDISMTYGKTSSVYCPVPGEASDTVIDRLEEGAFLFAYVGHGSTYAFDRIHCPSGSRYDMLHNNDLASLNEQPPLAPIALLSCCNTGWFDTGDKKPSLGTALLLHPNGPIAVMAGSRPTHPYANALRVKETCTIAFQRQTSTVGELDLQIDRAVVQPDAADAQLDRIAGLIARFDNWPSSLEQLRVRNPMRYNLFGDPATAIAMADSAWNDVTFDGATLRATMNDVEAGDAIITVERDRLTVDQRNLTPGDPCDDPATHDDRMRRYQAANDPVVLRQAVPWADGRLECTIDLADLPEAAIIKIYGQGLDSSGQVVDAWTAVKIRPGTSRRIVEDRID